MRDKPFCRLRAFFRRCSVHVWLCSAPGARGRREAAPAQLQPGKQKCPASSKSLHTEMANCFQNQNLHGSIEQRQHFSLSGHLPCLCFRELEQAEGIERHRASTHPVKLPEQWGSRRVGEPSGGAGKGALLPPVPVQAPCKLPSQALPTRASHLRYRPGIPCQDPTKLHSH